jgi:hypothetical protein
VVKVGEYYGVHLTVDVPEGKHNGVLDVRVSKI